MSQEIQNIDTPFLEEIKKNSGLTIAIGVLVLLMGFLAMGSPLIAGLSVSLMVGDHADHRWHSPTAVCNKVA